MPQEYTVRNPKTGDVVTFKWNGDKPPEDSDFEEVFKSVSKPETKPTVEPKPEKPKITSEYQGDFKPIDAGPLSLPLNLVRGGLHAIARKIAPTAIPQLAGEESGVLNPNLEENPLLTESWLPETTEDPGVVGKIRHGLYEGLIRPMASPLGAYSTFAVGNPAEHPSLPETFPTPKGNIENIAEKVAKPKIRVAGVAHPTEAVNLTTGEPIELAAKAAPEVTPKVEPELKPPNPFAAPRFNPRGRTGMTGVAQQGELDPRTLVGLAKSRTPSEPPPVRLMPDGSVVDNTGAPVTTLKIRKGGVVVDSATGERVSSLVRKKNVLDVRRDMATEIANLPRAIQSAYDISMPFRQGLGLIHTGGWWHSWGDMIKSLGSEDAFRTVMDSIYERPNFKRIKLPGGKLAKSFAEEAGLDITDLVNAREEQMISTIAEKIPGVRASNRAATAFVDKMRADVFDNLVEQAERQGLNPRKNLALAKQIAQYVNNASGRGSLGALEKNADQLAAVFFSPKLIASRVQMLNKILNPFSYKMTNPWVRRQYWKSMIGMATTWTTLGTLAKLGGADVSLDPDSADFGKIKIGNTRLDPAGGFQQYLVLAHRIASGEYTPTAGKSAGKSIEYGSRYGVKTEQGAVVDFLVNKLAPIPATVSGVLDRSKYKPFQVGDESIRLLMPMIVQDISEVLQDDPSLLPMVAGTAVGMGVQTYGERGRGHRFLPESIFPEESDLSFPRR